MKRLAVRGNKETLDDGRLLGPYDCELLCDGEPLGGVVSFEIGATIGGNDEIPKVRITFETYVQDIEFACVIPMAPKKG